MIICTRDEAWSKAYDKFMAQRKFGKVYVIACTVGRRPFAVICTGSDIKKNKLNGAMKAAVIFGESQREIDRWTEWRENPNLQKARDYTRYFKAGRTMQNLEAKWRAQHENT